MSRTLDLHGKTALVTGASSGIGAEIARVLARREIGTLVLSARRQDRLSALQKELTSRHPDLHVLVRPADLRDRAQTSAMIDGLEAEGVTIDVLVNNAGFGDRGLVDERPWSKIEALLEVNVVGATWLIHRLLPNMLARGSGGILNIGSIAGIVSLPGAAVYGASKSYLNALSEWLHAELSGTGVIVTAVLPGPVPTEFRAMANKVDAAPVEDTEAAAATSLGPSSLPSFVTVSAEECAEQAVEALVRGRARVVPGATVKVLARVLDNLPRPITRTLLQRISLRARGDA